MASNHTANYGLSQWEPGDAFVRTEFNGDNVKVDAALHGLETGKAEQSAVAALEGRVEKKAEQTDLTSLRRTVEEKARMTCGTYTGDGEEMRFVAVGFIPKAVIVETPDGQRHQSSTYGVSGGLALSGHPLSRGASPWWRSPGTGSTPTTRGNMWGASTLRGTPITISRFSKKG